MRKQLPIRGRSFWGGGVFAGADENREKSKWTSGQEDTKKRGTTIRDRQKPQRREEGRVSRTKIAGQRFREGKDCNTPNQRRKALVTHGVRPRGIMGPLLGGSNEGT